METVLVFSFSVLCVRLGYLLLVCGSVTLTFRRVGTRGAAGETCFAYHAYIFVPEFSAL
jgi:hypothetical protein